MIHVSVNGEELTVDMTGAVTAAEVSAKLAAAGLGSSVRAITPEEAAAAERRHTDAEAAMRTWMIEEIRAWEPDHPSAATPAESAQMIGLNFATIDRWPTRDVSMLHGMVFDPGDTC